MDASLAPQILSLQERLRAIVDREVAPHAAEVDANGTWPAHSMRAMAAAGLMGLQVPTDLGGGGEGLVALSVATETIARACPSSALCFGMHCVGTAVIAATDTGEGMPPEVVARAFEPFFTTKPEGKGTGLGLSMAYGFAKQSGGHIRIYSEPGTGTTIKLYLPRSMEREVETPPAATGPILGGDETILVVEDDLGVQAAVVSTLQNLGYRVLRASEAQAALTVLESGIHVDLLFTDVVMPGPLRSPDLALRARMLLPDIAVLFTSGYTQNAIVHGGRLDTGVELLSKPYRQEDLARKIRQVLAQRIAAQAAAAAAASEEQVTNQRPPRILLVEDQEDLRDTTLQLLEILECEAQGAATAEAAEALLAGGARFDVMITDITLPGRSGVELAQQVHRDYSDMKIVFCSGYGAPADIPADLKSWNLPKPYSLDDLESLLAQLGLRTA